MGIRSEAEKQWNLASRAKKWLHSVASDFDRKRLNPPIRTIIKGKDGRQYEELLDEPGWITVGYVPKPTTSLGWFVYHITHGLLMRYPLRSVIAFALLHSSPLHHEGNDAKQSETMKNNRIDLWLNHADLAALIQCANHYRTSCQRIVETALAQASVRSLPADQPLTDYERAERIPIRLDRLGREQLETIAAQTGISHQDVLRLALRSLLATDTPPHAQRTT